MKIYLKRALLLAIGVVAVIALYRHIEKEKETAAQNALGETEQIEVQMPTTSESMDVLRMGNGVTLGQIRENAERGGVDVIVTEDGQEKVYTFTDVAADSWYANAVNFVVSAGLMTGIGEEPIFHPEYGISRESFAAILYRFTHGVSVQPETKFEDVAEDTWYYDAVSWVTNRRLMTALKPGVFGVGEFMTCEQTLIGLYRVAGEPETDGSLENYPYAAKVSDSGRNAVDWAWKNGLITEVECVWYPPQAISRAQVALLLMRYSAMG